ncbi:MAG: hypothetical protein KC502_03335 [Myxococcales bacterium]|nr:hypothetical protein [Myxococcales bacterium]
MNVSPWSTGDLQDLVIDDDEALVALPGVPWLALRDALTNIVFCWPADVDAMAAAWEDLTRQSNLLNWHPADMHELVRGPIVGADELCHLAVHKLIFQQLGAPEDWRSWLFAEAAASATDVLVLGALLAGRREAEFVPMQLDVLGTCWEDAGRSREALADQLAALAVDPVAAWREIVALIEDHITEQLPLTDSRRSAAAFAERIQSPWGPVLLHFQTAWWVAALRSPNRQGPAPNGLAILRTTLMSADSPLDALIGSV